MPAFWWVELDLFPLMGSAASGGVFWGVYGFSMSLGSLSADGWVCVPVLLVVWCGTFSTGACRQLGGVEMETSRRALANQYSLGLGIL